MADFDPLARLRELQGEEAQASFNGSSWDRLNAVMAEKQQKLAETTQRKVQGLEAARAYRDRQEALSSGSNEFANWVSGGGPLDSDLVRSGYAGGVKTVGDTVGSLGRYWDQGAGAIQRGLEATGVVADTPDVDETGSAVSRATAGFQEWMHEGADTVRQQRDLNSDIAERLSAPTGDILDPSTWSYGEDPSMYGYALRLAELAGQLAPQVAAAGGANPMLTGAAMGGASAGGSQAREAEERIAGMDHEALSQNSGFYADLISEGVDPEQAKEQTMRAAGNAAAIGGGAVGAAGGALTGYVFGPMQRAMSGTLRGRVGASTGLEAAGESVQEVSETVAARDLTNRAIEGDQSLTADTFGDAVLGALGGAGMGGVASAAGEAERLSARQRTRRADQEEQTNVFEQVRDTGDASAFLNRKDPENYAPDKAVAALSERVKKVELTPEQETETRKQIDGILGELEEEYELLETDLKAGSKEARAEQEQTLKILKDKLAATDETDTATRQRFEDAIAATEEAMAEDVPLEGADRKMAEARMSKLQRQLRESRKQRARLDTDTLPEESQIEESIDVINNATPQDAETEGSPVKSATDGVIRLAMRSPDALSEGQVRTLVENTNNALSDTQREYLRSFNDARVAENLLKDRAKVHKDVLQGGKGFRGISEYRQSINSLAQTGNRRAAKRQLDQLTAFRDSHRRKYAAAYQAGQQVAQDGGSIQIVRDQEGNWFQAAKKYLPEELRRNGGLEISGKSRNLIENIRKEFDTLQKAQRELQGTYTMAFGAEPAPATVENTDGRTNPENDRDGSVEAPSSDVSQAVSGTPDAPADEVAQESAQATEQVSEPAAEPEVNEADLEAEADYQDALNQEMEQDLAEDEQGSVSEASSASTSTTTQEAPENATEAQPEAVSKVSDDSAAPTAPVSEESTDSNAEPSTDTEAEPDSETATSETEAPSARIAVIENGTPRYGLLTKPEFVKVNLVGAYFRQAGTNDNAVTQMPLVQIPDFASALAEAVSLGDSAIDGLVQDYLSEPLNDRQRELLNQMADTLPDWAEKVGRGIPDWANTDSKMEYRFRDLVQFLVEDGQVEENIKAAVAAAAFTYVAEEAGGPALLTNDQIKTMLGREEDASVLPSEREVLQDFISRDKTVILALGQRAAAMLGLRTRKDAPVNHQSQLEQALGAHALKLLVDEQVMERTAVETDVVPELANGQQFFVKFKRDDEYQLTSPYAREINEASKETGSVLSKLFAFEPSLREPSLTPVPHTQETTSNTDRPVPKQSEEIMTAEGKREHKIRLDMHKLLNALTPEAQQAIAGIVDMTKKKVHKVNRKAVEAKNQALDREINRFHSFTRIMEDSRELNGIERPIYFGRSVWRHHRVGLSPNMVNPQTSKVQRHLMYMRGWETTVDLTDPDSETHQQFRLGIADALGVKTDKQENEDSLLDLETKLDHPDIQIAIAELRKHLRGEDFDSAAVVAGVAEAGEGFHSLDGLMNYAQYQQAIDSGETQFVSRMMREVDGITNGPMLAQLQLGAAPTADELAETLKRGGFYLVGDTTTQYGSWRKVEGNLDMYETMASDLDQILTQRAKNSTNDSVTLNAVYHFTGKLAENGKVLKPGRNLVKTPLTALVFGSGMSAVQNSMADGFIESVYTKLEDIANETEDGSSRPVELVKTLKHLNHIVTRGGGKAIDTTLTVDGALDELVLTKQQEQAIHRVYKDMIGEPMEDVMNNRFETFMNNRTKLNSAANTAFNLYNAAYEFLKAKKIEELTAAGGMPTAKLKEWEKQPNGKMKNVSRERPVQELTAEQEAEIQAQLKSIEPVIHSPFSKANNELTAGIKLSKTNRKLSGRAAYAGEIKFNPTTKAFPWKTMETAGYEVQEAPPGVAAIIMAIHSSDSAISAYSYRNRPALNVHDAHGLGLKHVLEGAKDLNQNTFRVLLDYSVTDEISQATDRTIKNFYKLMEEQGYPQELVESYKSVEAELFKKLDKDIKAKVSKSPFDAVAYTMSQARDVAYQSNVVKYGVLSKLNSVDQYGMQGGNYMVTDQDRAEAQAKLDSLAAPKVDALMKQSAIVKKQVKAAKANPEQTVSNPDVEPEVTSESDPLANAGPFDSAWGNVGRPTIDSDPALVQFFEENPNPTTRQMMRALRKRIDSGTQGRTKAFYRELLNQVAKSVDLDMPIQYVRPDTPSNVDSEETFDARGLAVVGGANPTIYVKSPDFTTSGITMEMLLHELVHHSVATTTANPSQEAKPLVTELEKLLEKARATVKSDPDLEAKYSNSVKDVHELIAWGMTNPGFQREVLNQIKTRSTTRNNSLVTGMQDFIATISKLLFGKNWDNRKSSGLSVLMSNVSGLMNEAQQTQANADQIRLAYEDPADSVLRFTTTQIYDALENQHKLSNATDTRLRTLLEGIVDRLHGPYGAFKSQAERHQALTPEDVYIKSLFNGELPFASKTLGAGFKLNDQQAFVLEQVEATVREGMTSHATAYTELKKLFNEAKKKMAPSDFYEGDWNQASPEEQRIAEKRYNFVFRLDQNGDSTSDYLSRFAALGLTYEPLYQKLNFSTAVDRTRLRDMPLGQRLAALFRKIMNLLAGRLTNTRDGQPADQKMVALIDQLVDIEAKQRAKVLHRKDTVADKIEGSLQQLSEDARAKIEKFGRSPFFRERKNTFVRGAGSIASAVAGDRVEIIIEEMKKTRDKHFRQREGLLASMISEFRGATETTLTAHQLLRMANKNEQERMQHITETAKIVRESFENGGDYLTQQDKDAITKVMLRADLSSLMESYSLDQIEELVRDDQALEQAIADTENEVPGTGQRRAFYLMEARNLGHFMATGRNVSENLLMNAHNIAQMYGSNIQGNLTNSQAMEAVPAIDRLATLYALKDSGRLDRTRVSEVMRRENARGEESGVRMTLMLHQRMQQDALESLFENNPVHFMKGYTKEIYNPSTDVRAMRPSEATDLERLGYKDMGPLPIDPNDPDQEARHFYVRKQGGLQPHITGIMSYTGRRARGSQLNSGLTSSYFEGLNQRNDREIAGLRNEKQKSTVDVLSKFNSTYDPNRLPAHKMAPVLNQYGQVVNYRYLMESDTKDNVLERNNTMEDVLGAMAGSVFDKQASEEQNLKAVEAMYRQYVEEFGTRSDSYIAVGPNAKDPEMREVYRLLPEATKAEIKRVWGTNEMMVRSDLVDITFGYRKYSITNIWDKDRDEKNAAEKVIEGFVEFLLRLAGVKDENKIKTIQAAEDMWQEVVKEVKDILVVKTGITLLGNVISNITELLWFGVNPVDLVKNHRIALQAVVNFRRDSNEVYRLKQMRDSGFTQPQDLDDVNQRIIELEDSMARNPAKHLIDEGLMQTIVEDVDTHTDKFSYKSRLTQKAEGFTDRLPDSMRSAGRVMYMAHDTTAYKLLSQGTQYSDFVARYTLYEHMTKRKNRPMAHKEAIQLVSDAFVNYDIPTHRSLQYLNDMGLIMFTKYYMRIQKVIMHLYRDNPARAIMLLSMNHYFTGLQTIMDSTFWNRIGNPFDWGAAAFPGVLDEMASVKLAMSPFNN